MSLQYAIILKNCKYLWSIIAKCVEIIGDELKLRQDDLHILY